MNTNYNPYENVLKVMDEAVALGNLSTDMYEMIRNPQRELKYIFLFEWIMALSKYLKDTGCNTLIFVVLLREEFVFTRTQT